MAIEARGRHFLNPASTQPSQVQITETCSCAECQTIDHTRVVDRLDNADAALVYYDRFLDALPSRLAFIDATVPANTLRRTRALREQKSDIPGALARYRHFAELSRNADPVLPVQVPDE